MLAGFSSHANPRVHFRFELSLEAPFAASLPDSYRRGNALIATTFTAARRLLTKHSDTPSNILSFWRDVEVFCIPSTPTSRDIEAPTALSRVSCSSETPQLPWEKPEYTPSPKATWLHTIYLGSTPTQYLQEEVRRQVIPNAPDDEPSERTLPAQGWLGAFVVNSAGVHLPDSYLVASFVEGLAALREPGGLSTLPLRLQRAGQLFAERCAAPAGIAGEPADAYMVPPQALAATAGGVRKEAVADGVGLDSAAAKSSSARTAETGEQNAPNPRPFTRQLLQEEVRILVTKLTGTEAPIDWSRWEIVVKTSRIPIQKEQKAKEAAIDFLNSFFLDDLQRLIGAAESGTPMNAGLAAYLGSPAPLNKRVDVLADHNAMAALTSAKYMPLGRWPSNPEHHLSLAQQAAVATILRPDMHRAILGVNGPPGTGKTTLLCDVIANVVIERAARIAALVKPADIFSRAIQIGGKWFSPINPQVMGASSIVVTSSNNNAVKNITQELPALAKIDPTSFPNANYFAEVAASVLTSQKVMQEVDGEQVPVPTWGIVAAALGNSGNRDSFIRGFFNESTPKRVDAAPMRTMAQILEEAITKGGANNTAWEETKQTFLTSHAHLTKVTVAVAKAEAAIRRTDKVLNMLRQQRTEAATALDNVSSRALEQHHLAAATKQHEQDLDRLVNSLVALNEALQLSLLDSLLSKLGIVTAKLRARELQLLPARVAIANTTGKLDTAKQAQARAEADLLTLRKHLQDLNDNIRLLQQEIDMIAPAREAASAYGVTNFATAALFDQSHEELHRSSAGVSQAIDLLRGRLFLQAMNLHRDTILANGAKFKGNLRIASAMLKGTAADKLEASNRPVIWDSFFFVVPVVSTTLASFPRLFKDMGADSIGMVLVDEAGQATPQHAAGAIYRAKRTVMVGDPLQIEPVVTSPPLLIEELRRLRDVSPIWSPSHESAQTLADRVTTFGSWVGNVADADCRVWTGMPLRTHRRCEDPMFSVANSIAYDNQMVQGKVDRKGVPTKAQLNPLPRPSTWLHVTSSKIEHPVCKEELDAVVDLLKQLQPANGRPPHKTFVISPFRKVAQAVTKVVQPFAHVEAGTVHTFQGKEAPIVILVLGTGPENVGARNWASSKPNLLNVAVTRAQHRLYVVGDVNLWSGMPYFQELHRALAQ